MPESRRPNAPEQEERSAPEAPEPQPRPEPALAAPEQYKVKSNGITGAGGVTYMQGEILTAEQVGDQARIDKLLAKGAIEAV